MNYVIRDYQSNDKSKIFELFKNTFGKKYPTLFWDWRYNYFHDLKPIIKLAFSDDQLIAHYLIHPVTLKFNSQNMTALFSMTTMTHPNFSGKGIMTKLALEAYQTGLDQAYPFVFGFANNNSKNLFINKLGFSQIQHMEKIFSKLTNFSLKTHYTCQEITNSDNLLLEDLPFNLKNLMIPRTLSYLHYRFFNHPIYRYFFYLIYDDTKPVGYFVLKIYQNECHLVDYIINNDINCYNVILNKTSSICQEYNLTTISLWKNQQYEFMIYLESLKFKSKFTETFFICKNLSGEFPSDILTVFSNWYVTMSDSDIF